MKKKDIIIVIVTVFAVLLVAVTIVCFIIKP